MTQDEIIKAKERLIRIMGTFDLATGHADTFDELLDSLETELRDVLGHYRAAVKEHLTQEPVAWGMLHDNGHFIDAIHPDEHARVEGKYIHPLYTTEQRTWIGLTDEEREEIALELPIDAVSITEAKLKKKHT